MGLPRRLSFGSKHSQIFVFELRVLKVNQDLMYLCVRSETTNHARGWSEPLEGFVKLVFRSQYWYVLAVSSSQLFTRSFVFVRIATSLFSHRSTSSQCSPTMRVLFLRRRPSQKDSHVIRQNPSHRVTPNEAQQQQLTNHEAD